MQHTRTLSHALWSVSLLRCVHCPRCNKWRAASTFARHDTCGACQSAAQRQARELAALPPLPSSPPPEHSPPPPLFDRPQSCLDQLTLVQRAAIVTLDKMRHSRSEIAREIP